MKYLKLNKLTNAGFTLLEVVIAMAIMTIAFSSILAVEGGSIRASVRAKRMNIVSMLIKNQMVDAEYKIEGKTFDEVPKEESGTFPDPFQDFRWKRTIKELKFPNIAAGIGAQPGQGGGGGESQMGETISRLMTNFLSKAIRELTVTITWKQGTTDQSYSISTYWVNLNNEFKLTE
jgi:general secretion pathway protein I